MVLLALLAAGCGPKETDEEITSTEPSAAKFEGKPDATYAGSYKTPDGRSSYKLSDDGKFVMDGTASTPGGPIKTHTEGEWAVNGDRMLFKYNDTVVPYAYKKEGNKLKLSLTGSLKRETVLVKQ